MTNGLTHTYNLTIDGLAVTAALTFNGAHGILLCSYDDRSISVRLGSQVEYMREDACRALKSRRVMADMVGEAPYSRKATCRSIANRLDLLVQQGDIEGDAAQEVINEVRGKWRGLQTSHDFDRFASTNLVAKQHLALCKRTDDDFETLIAPALAAAIKEDIETDLEIGAPVMPTGDRDAALTIAQLATGKVNEVLTFHDLPTADTYAAGIDIVDEEIAHLRGSLEESDDLASDRWTALTSVNEVLRCMLDDRGVPTSEHIGDNLRAVVEYLSAVEAAAAKWQTAGLAWQRVSVGLDDGAAKHACRWCGHTSEGRHDLIACGQCGGTATKRGTAPIEALRMFPHDTQVTRHTYASSVPMLANGSRIDDSDYYSAAYLQRYPLAVDRAPMATEQRYAHTIEGIGEDMLARRFRFTAEMGDALVAGKETT